VCALVCAIHSVNRTAHYTHNNITTSADQFFSGIVNFITQIFYEVFFKPYNIILITSTVRYYLSFIIMVW
jgi:hypothetical protein